jgi:SPP1 family predicted phage head-tail adaptor
MIRAGELRDRVTIQQPTTTSGGAWGPQPGWSDLTTVWAKVLRVAASERSVQDGVQSVVSHRITMRYRPDLTSKHRLVYRGRPLDIVGVNDPDGRRHELLIEAREHPQEAGADV